MPAYLFVCGTLLPELVPEHLAGLMGTFTSVGAASIAGRLYDLGEYPGAIADEQASERVVGWIYEIPPGDAALKQLDAYEGIDPKNSAASLFLRRRAVAELAGGGQIDCWLYAYNRAVEGRSLIVDGDYLKFVADRSHHG
jgi:gamma-glutamylcyclotransferase (GGCT)/AIG2-like uncharacterized protein YtfP